MINKTEGYTTTDGHTFANITDALTWESMCNYAEIVVPYAKTAGIGQTEITVIDDATKGVLLDYLYFTYHFPNEELIKIVHASAPCIIIYDRDSKEIEVI